jgi:FKBP-type peptidyl-prolyl cis-trans isomerase FklB
MCTLLTNSLYLLTAGCMLLAVPAQAQDTPPAKTSPAAPAKTSQTPATGTQGPTTPKTGQGSAAKPATAPLVLKTQQEKASYAIGANIGRGMKKDGVQIDPRILSRGMSDAIAGKKLAMTDEEMQASLSVVQTEVRKRLEVEAAAVAAANKATGEQFLAANKTKEGIVTLPSGLQYKILKEGTGPKPTATDEVVCNYRGTLVDGTEFDSSYKRGTPATFPVDKVIKGWTEALQLMSVGSKWELFVPSNLAYGERGAGQRGSDVIAPNSTLIFEVELMSIKEKTEAKPGTDVKPDAKPDAKPADPAPKTDPKPQGDAKPQDPKPQR